MVNRHRLPRRPLELLVGTAIMLLILAVIFSAPLIHGQQQNINLPDCQRSFTFTAAGNGLDFDNRQTACTTWTLVYQNTGFSALSIEFQGAPDNAQAPGTYVTWPSLTSGSLPLTGTVGGSITGYKYQSWVRVKLNSVTGTGQISGTLIGYRPIPGQDVASPALVTPSNGSVAGSTRVAGSQLHYFPAALGLNAAVLHANPTELLSNIIDLQGARSLTFFSNCTQTYGVKINVYRADGTTSILGASSTASTANGASFYSMTFIAENTAHLSNGGTVSGAWRLPFPALRFALLNAGATPGTCTCELTVQY